MAEGMVIAPRERDQIRRLTQQYHETERVLFPLCYMPRTNHWLVVTPFGDEVRVVWASPNFWHEVKEP